MNSNDKAREIRDLLNPAPDRPRRPVGEAELSGRRMDETWLRSRPVTGTVLPADTTPRIPDAGLTRGLRIETRDRPRPGDERPEVVPGS